MSEIQKKKKSRWPTRLWRYMWGTSSSTNSAHTTSVEPTFVDEEDDGIVKKNDEDMFVLINSLSSTNINKESAPMITQSTIERVDKEVEAIQTLSDLANGTCGTFGVKEEDIFGSLSEHQAQIEFDKKYDWAYASQDILCKTPEHNPLDEKKRSSLDASITNSADSNDHKRHKMDTAIEIEFSTNTWNILDKMEKGELLQSSGNLFKNVTLREKEDQEDDDSDSEGVVDVLCREFEGIVKNVSGFFKSTCSSPNIHEDFDKKHK